ncbi:MAG: hypothetical protein WDO06_00900 [Actinomycetota bacterium]
MSEGDSISPILASSPKGIGVTIGRLANAICSERETGFPHSFRNNIND